MSASNKKKLRKEERSAKMTERQQAEQNDAKKLKKNTIVFTVVIALVFCIGIGMIAYNLYASSGLQERFTTAAKIGDRELTAAELNYYYYDSLYSLSSDWYSMYLLQYEDGLNTSVALDQQAYKDDTYATWGDYFVDMAIEEASGVLALCDAAEKAGYSLSAEELAEIDASIASLKESATTNGYSSLNKYLQAMYGNGAREKTYRAYVEDVTLAQSYYNHYSESLEYTAEDIEAYDNEHAGEYSTYSFTYFQISPDDFLLHEDEEEHNHSDAETEVALKTALETAEALVASGATNKEELDAAIAALDVYKTDAAEETTEETTEEVTEETTEETTTEEATEETTTEETATEETVAEEATEETATEEATEETVSEETAEEEVTEESTEEEESTVPTSIQYTDYYLSYMDEALADWLAEEGRETGKIGLVTSYVTDEEGNPTEEVSCYYVAILEGETRYEENMVTVRHILAQFEGGTVDEESGDTIYSDEEKAAAKAEIEKIQAEFESGEKTVEAFAKLAETYSDDNADEGGLYEDVYIGEMEENFEDWCFEEGRQSGDVGVVETSYGYHLIYFVETQEDTYRDYMIESDMRAEDADNWYVELRDSYKNAAEVKNTSYMNTSVTLAN